MITGKKKSDNDQIQKCKLHDICNTSDCGPAYTYRLLHNIPFVMQNGHKNRPHAL